MSNICRIGVGGPVGSGKTALIEAITPKLLEKGLKVLIITNDIVTTEDAKHVRKTLKGILLEDRIIGVETGACPHTAVREDPSMNIAAVEDTCGFLHLCNRCCSRRQDTTQGRSWHIAIGHSRDKQNRPCSLCGCKS